MIPVRFSGSPPCCKRPGPVSPPPPPPLLSLAIHCGHGFLWGGGWGGRGGPGGLRVVQVVMEAVGCGRGGGQPGGLLAGG